MRARQLTHLTSGKYPISVSSVTTKLLRWYDCNRRELPWRAPPGGIVNPYHVWLSEIMLQQTTVSAVKPYFVNFLERWPSVEELSLAELDEILHAWQGLGYYSRARNLHKCAKEVMTKWSGKFPESEANLLSLPGVGPYTAAAVAAIGFGKDAVPVDVNIERVIARLYAIDKPLPSRKVDIKRFAKTLLPKQRTGDFAQALMDFGAIVCRRKKPRCSICLLKKECAGFKQGDPERLPFHPPKKIRPTRYGTVFWLECEDGSVLVQRREEMGLLGGMIEFPSSPWQDELPVESVLLSYAPSDASWEKIEGTVKHVFSHFYLVLDIRKASILNKIPENSMWCKPADFNKLALPTLMKKVANHVTKNISSQES